MKLKRSSENKKVKNANSSKYDGITFKSDLEKFCYQQLKANNIQFKYQPDNYILESKFDICFDCYELIGKIQRDKVTNKVISDTRRFDIVRPVRDIKYTPDFSDPDQNKWIIETKGFANDAFPLRWKLFKKYLTDRNFTGKVFKPENRQQVLQCIEIIKSI